MFNGKMRKLVLTAARNGYFFTLDRVTGERLVTSKYGLATNWAKSVEQERRARSAIPTKDPTVGGVAGFADLGRHDQLGAACLLSGYGSLLRGRRERLFDLFT